MESFDKAKNFWQENKNRETSPFLLNKEGLEKIIQSRVNEEKKIVAGYFWVSFVYQNLIYAFMCHLIVKFWGDAQVMLLGLAGALLYIPFTIIMMRKFKLMYKQTSHKPTSSAQDIQANVKNQYALLSGFFRFKKRFDLAGVPLSSLILVLLLFKLYVKGGIEGHLIGALISFLVILVVFITATYLENKRAFINTLRQFDSILVDIDNNN